MWNLFKTFSNIFSFTSALSIFFLLQSCRRGANCLLQRCLFSSNFSSFFLLFSFCCILSYAMCFWWWRAAGYLPLCWSRLAAGAFCVFIIAFRRLLIYLFFLIFHNASNDNILDCRWQQSSFWSVQVFDCNLNINQRTQISYYWSNILYWIFCGNVESCISLYFSSIGYKFINMKRSNFYFWTTFLVNNLRVYVWSIRCHGLNYECSSRPKSL